MGKKAEIRKAEIKKAETFDTLYPYYQEAINNEDVKLYPAVLERIKELNLSLVPFEKKYENHQKDFALEELDRLIQERDQRNAQKDAKIQEKFDIIEASNDTNLLYGFYKEAKQTRESDPVTHVTRWADLMLVRLENKLGKAQMAEFFLRYEAEKLNPVTPPVNLDNVTLARSASSHSCCNIM